MTTKKEIFLKKEKKMFNEEEKNFEKELEYLINRYSLENESNTPDFILAEFVKNCLKAWNKATKERDNWYSVNLEPDNSYFRCDL